MGSAGASAAGDGTATVVAARGHRLELEISDQRRVPARTRGKRMRVVCGDRVTAEPIHGETDWLVLDIEERRNALQRVDNQGRPETLAANIDRLVVVCSPLPAPDFFIVDRYLCAAALTGIDAAVVFNKTDLSARVPPELDLYATLGYAVARTRATGRPDVGSLAALLAGRTSMLVGQSGVGKSSLINALAPDASQRVAEVSAARREGRHTTVTAEMITLSNGGRLIDSPGVRDFAPYIGEEADVQAGFAEIRDASQRCRFNDCRHIAEPACAVLAAVERGGIDERRYRSYRRLLSLTRRLRRE